jgi:uncharacterized protein (DUF433 family)
MKTDYEIDRRISTMTFLREGRLIARNKRIMFGAYTIRGTRLTVACMRGRHMAGDSINLLCREYYLRPEVVDFVVNKWAARKG